MKNILFFFVFLSIISCTEKTLEISSATKYIYDRNQCGIIFTNSSKKCQIKYEVSIESSDGKVEYIDFMLQPTDEYEYYFDYFTVADCDTVFSELKIKCLKETVVKSYY